MAGKLLTFVNNSALICEAVIKLYAWNRKIPRIFVENLQPREASPEA